MSCVLDVGWMMVVQNRRIPVKEKTKIRDFHRKNFQANQQKECVSDSNLHRIQSINGNIFENSSRIQWEKPKASLLSPIPVSIRAAAH